MGVEAVLCMVGVGLILGLPIGEIAALVLVRFSFGLLFMAGNLMIERLFGGMTSKVLVMFFYYLSMIVLAVPGTVACVLATIVWPQLAGFFLLAAVQCVARCAGRVPVPQCIALRGTQPAVIGRWRKGKEKSAIASPGLAVYNIAIGAVRKPKEQGIDLCI